MIERASVCIECLEAFDEVSTSFLHLSEHVSDRLSTHRSTLLLQFLDIFVNHVSVHGRTNDELIVEHVIGEWVRGRPSEGLEMLAFEVVQIKADQIVSLEESREGYDVFWR